MIIEKNSLINKNPDLIEILSNDPVKSRCKIGGQKQTGNEVIKEEKEPDSPLII